LRVGPFFCGKIKKYRYIYVRVYNRQTKADDHETTGEGGWAAMDGWGDGKTTGRTQEPIKHAKSGLTCNNKPIIFH
jgi:hypothetical protein